MGRHASQAARLLPIAVLLVGLWLRVVPLASDPDAPLQTCDGRANWDLAQNLAQGDGLTITDPLVAEHYCRLPYGPSHHYSPLLPILEGFAILLLGETLLALTSTLILLSLTTVAATYWTSRDLFGPQAGLRAAAVVSVDWSTVFFGTRQGYAENLVLLTLVLTLWAIMKSLQDERYILAAGLFAGLGYVSKAAVGWFFLIAGLGGLAWRLWHHGPRVFASRNYLAAIGIFATIFLAWSARNLYHFWDGTAAGLLTQWQTSSVIAGAIARAMSRPDLMIIGLVGKLPILLGGVLAPVLGLLHGFRNGIHDWRREDASCLWLASLLLFVLGWLFAATFWVVEQSPLMWGDPIRYVAPALIPLLWVVFLTDPSWRTRSGWLLVYSISLVLAYAMPWLLRPYHVLGSPQ